MSITSFYFLCFFAVVLLCYYVVPKKIQWCEIVAASVAYYLLSGNGFLLCYPVASSLVCFTGGRLLGRLTEAENGQTVDAGKAKDIQKKWVLAGTLCGTIGILAVLKYVNFLIYTYNGIASLWQGQPMEATDFLIPLGISFYTMSMLGYVIDLYYGIGRQAGNYGRFLVYGLYFPTMISGPIMKYAQMSEQMDQPHFFNYKQVTFGMQRMVWGFFKKLVISERMAMVTNTIYGAENLYGGGELWLAAVCFVLQLYTDFSGCMDIVLGMSQTLGIELPENFRTPFFSTSIAEFWRRWHITLGIWMKDYVFYPLLRSPAFAKLGKGNKARFGKKAGKQMTTFTAMFILWFTVGLWHGGEWKYVLGSGLIHWCYIVVGEVTEPFFTKLWKSLHVNPQNKILHFFRQVRTFLLVTIAFVFFRAEDVAAGARALLKMFTQCNPMVWFSGTLFTFGLDWVEFTIAMVSLMILWTVSILQQKGSLRERIAGKGLPVRWLIWYALLFYTILLGCYGPEYSASEFIYQGF